MISLATVNCPVVKSMLAPDKLALKLIVPPGQVSAIA